jgi:hypothetical protein
MYSIKEKIWSPEVSQDIGVEELLGENIEG